MNNNRVGSRSCRHRRLCEEAKKTMVYLRKLPVVIDSVKTRLAQAISMVCSSDSIQVVKLQTNKSREPLNLVESYLPKMTFCADVLPTDCPGSYFVRTASGHSPSFFPEKVHFETLSGFLRSSYIDLNWSQNVKNPWCRFSCLGDKAEAADVMHRVVAVYIKVLRVITVAIAFACLYVMFCCKSNLSTMTSNPDRTYLYLNMATLFQSLIHMIPGYTIGDSFSWCNHDLSLVTSFNEATAECKIEASGVLAIGMTDLLVNIWVFFVWRKTMKSDSIV